MHARESVSVLAHCIRIIMRPAECHRACEGNKHNWIVQLVYLYNMHATSPLYCITIYMK